MEYKKQKSYNNDENSNTAYDSGMKSLSKSVHTAFIILLILIVFMLLKFISFGGYFAVNPQESVVVLQFGKFKACYEKDWHWFLPYPVNQFIHIKRSPQFLDVSFSSLQAALMENPAQIPPLNMVSDRYLITADGNILHSTWQLSYQVSEAEKFYQKCLSSTNDALEDANVYENGVNLGPRGVQTLVKNLFIEAAINVTSKYDVTDIYDSNRNIYADAVKSEFSRRLLEEDIGLVVDSVTLNSVMPPAKIAEAFNSVAAAMNQKAVLKNQAEEYSLNVVNKAKSDAAAIISNAENYKTQIVADIKAENIYFKSILSEYIQNPETVLMTLYNNTLAEVLANQDNKFIIGSNSDGTGSQQVRIKLNTEPAKRKATKATGEVQ